MGLRKRSVTKIQVIRCTFNAIKIHYNFKVDIYEYFRGHDLAFSSLPPRMQYHPTDFQGPFPRNMNAISALPVKNPVKTL